jgi:hypothetical protein
MKAEVIFNAMKIIGRDNDSFFESEIIVLILLATYEL